MNNYKILKEFETNLIYLQDILSSDSTDNIQLNKVGKILFGDLFVGVYPSSRMPILTNGQMCIINTDNKKGVHWIACYRYNNKTYTYDSFSRDVKSLSPFWKKKHSWINANSDRDQSFSSSLCGQISMSWLISANLHKPNKIISII